MVETRSGGTPRKRAQSPARGKSPARAKSPGRKGKKKPFLLLDAKRMPFWLYLPNLIGYVRVYTLYLALMEANPGSAKATACLVLSLTLDYIDGPAARKFGMCTQFGDLLDHVCDHITMGWLVHVTTTSEVNRWANVAHAAVALGYMALTGHYFKHAKSANAVTAVVEANNYFNMPSLLWNANTVCVPLVKMSYAVEYGMAVTDSTMLLDLCDYLGLIVTVVYTLACVHAALPKKD